MSFFNGLVKGLTWNTYELSKMDHSDITETTLYEVEWEDETTVSFDRVTRVLVWSGGAEKEITYVERDWMYGWHDWVEAGADIETHVLSDPAYTEVIEREEDYETETKTKTRTAWVTDVPPEAEPTGEEKVVYGYDDE